MGKVIAIDGPSGAGKSTIARMLAEIFGFEYLDTGALYRAVALGLRRSAIAPEDPDEEIGRALGGISVGFSEGKILLNGQDVSAEIRTPEVGHYSSVFSARKVVRDFLLPLQRSAAGACDIVAEGRDIATVVFPDAWKKFYLDASVGERARRRYGQLKENGITVTMEDAEEDVVKRDERDSTRQAAPLRAADDAVVIDSTGLSREEVLKAMTSVIKEGGVAPCRYISPRPRASASE